MGNNAANVVTTHRFKLSEKLFASISKRKRCKQFFFFLKKKPSRDGVSKEQGL